LIAKLTSAGTQFSLDKILPEVEFAINNTIHRSTGTTPSKLLFGVNQRGVAIDFLGEYLEKSDESRNLEDIRCKAVEKIASSQKYNEITKDRNRVESNFKIGDYVVIKNFVSSPGACKKVIPKFKGPYVIIKVLPNDRYLIKDVEGFQLTQIPYEGIWEAANIKKWINN